MTHPRKGRPYKINLEELVRQHAAGWPQRRMAEHHGVNIRSISRALSNAGLTTPNPASRKRMTEEWKAEARELLDGGASLIEVARTTGVGECTMTRYFPGQGWDRTTSGQYANAVRKANRELARIGHGPLRPAGPSNQHRSKP